MIYFFRRLSFSPDLYDYAIKSHEDGVAAGVFAPGAHPGHEYLAAGAQDPDGRWVGVATWYRPDGEQLLWLHMLWVDPAHRRGGLGSKLVCRVIAHAEQCRLPLDLGVMPTNANAARLYASLGFLPTSITYRKDPVIMAREIAKS